MTKQRHPKQLNHAKPRLQCGKPTKNPVGLCHDHRIRGKRDRRKGR